ncbi:MAG TPA: tetratricopeptide repeat protein [Terriglobales bacterium]|nr:tetratricopeptide repeat protein [Terriglobales bacterium]
MAFGFGFNKQKLLNSAEKYVQQGKLQNAIAEYEKILKNDSKDLTVSNTVGDLYARLGENDKAVSCFKSVGDAYAAQGFTVKAIAMYKKITKIKSTLEGVLKLAELYTQQGLFNDARAQYLQVAEEFLRGGELEQAVRIFQKILEMDPENTAMRVRLGEVYVRLGKKNEAWEIFSAAADNLRSRGQLDAAEDILKRMLNLDPGNSKALLLRGRNAVEGGENDVAIRYLEKVPDLDSHPDGLRDLLKAYLAAGRLADAEGMATKLLNVHNDVAGVSSLCDALMQSGQYADALHVYHTHAERMLTTNSEKVLEHLHGIISHVRENTQSLNSLLELFQKAGDTTHISEVIELLAHAYVQGGELAKARDMYQNLAAMEPENPLHMKNYEQVVGMMGNSRSGGRMISAEEGAVMVDEMEATAPAIEQHYPDAVSLAVRAALTDADLFVSYNMPGKAVVPLLAVLPQAPRDVRLNQRLAALHTRAERFAEAAVCCRTLESVYSEFGHPDEALRYGELATRYEERSGLAKAAPTPAPQSEPWPTASLEESVPDAPAPDTEPAEFAVHTAIPQASAHATEFDVQAPSAHAAPEFSVSEPAAAESSEEFDLSEEWEGSVSDDSETAPPEEPAPISAAPQDPETARKKAIVETAEEVRFYLGHSMLEQARASMAKLESLTQNPALLATLRAEIAIAEADAADLEEPAMVEEVEPAPPPPPPPAPRPTSKRAVAPEPKGGVLDEFVSDLESSLPESFLPEPAAEEPPPLPPPQPKTVPAPQAHPAAIAAQHKGGVLGEFVADLESALPENFLAGAPLVQPGTRFDIEPEPQPASATAPAAMAASAAATSPVATPAPKLTPPPAPAPTGSPTLTFKGVKKPAAPAPGKFSAAGVDLAEMFGELKQEMEEEVTTTEEDPETHYNLGVAFREMGLLDEAIGELQKVCQVVEQGHTFPHIMQTYTWLAQCFLDKGVPEAAIKWYEKALKLPALDGDTRLALHYELASAYETAKNKPAALSHFMEVYGSNIDYRDVAERIKALKS